jgi:hypothetical protein
MAGHETKISWKAVIKNGLTVGISAAIQLFKGFFVRSNREFRSEARTVRSGSI